MSEHETSLLDVVPAKATPDRAAVDGRVRALVHEHFDWIWRMLRRLGVSSDFADDAAQKVFWTAARKIRRDPSPSDGKFLLAIAICVASDHRRWRRRRR